MKTLMALAIAICWMWGAGAAYACRCDPVSPQAGFDRAQYVFIGKVVRAEHHTWLIEATAASMSADELESAAAELETLRGMSLSALDERLRAPEMA